MHISDHVLRCFLMLADTRQFTVAAERCHMTQSALSQLISRLETRVGVRLFDRESRSVSLTEEGRRLAVSAHRIKAELDHALADLRDVATLQTGHVSLAVVPSLAVMWLPAILHAYRELHPGVRIQIHDVSSVQCLELVQQGVVDFALNSLIGSPSEVHSRHLFDEHLYVVCPVDHPLTAEENVTVRVMRGVRFLHLQGTGNMLVRTGKAMGMARHVLQTAGIVDTGFEVNNLATLAGLVAAGFGVCLSPESSLPQFNLLPTVAVRINPQWMIRPIYCIHRKTRELSPAALTLCDMFLEPPPVSAQQKPRPKPSPRASRRAGNIS